MPDLWFLTPHLLTLLLAVPTVVLAGTFARAWSGFVAQTVDRQAHVPWTLDRITVLARDTVLRAACRTLALFTLRNPPPPSARTGPPVLVVPDPEWGRSSTAALVWFLQHRGYVVWPVRWERSDTPLPDRAEELARRIDMLCASTGRSHVDVVAAGFGGVIAGWAVRHRGAGAHVRRVISLGTPWRGTRMAVFRRAPSSAEARTDSLLLEGLLPLGVPTWSLWCPDDPEVVPATSAVAEVERNVAVDGAGHLGLLLSSRSFRAVIQALQADISSAGSPAAPHAPAEPATAAPGQAS